MPSVATKTAMTAMTRRLSSPRATEGLAPKLVEQIATLLEEIAKRGISILLVEQKLTIALKITNRVLVMGHGELVFEGTPDDLLENEKIRSEWQEV